MIKVLIGKPFLDKGMIKFREHFEIVEPMKGESFKEAVDRNHDIHVIIPPLGEKVEGTLMDKCKNLKLICSEGVGYDHIDVVAAKERGIWVTHTPDILSSAVADLIFTLILCCARRVVEGIRYIENREFQGYDKRLLLGKEMRGATIGIIGMGRIGEELAKRAQGFGMNILYYSRSRKEVLESELSMKFVTLKELIVHADIIVPIINYSTEVFHLFNQEAFKVMKKDAIFVNASRGKVVDEEALACHLMDTPTFYAGLDVYEFEPEINEKLRGLSNVICLPHIGSATGETRYNMAMMNFDDIKRVEHNEIPRNLVKEFIEQ